MANDRDAPGLAQDFLSAGPAHVVHIGVMFRKPKDPERPERITNSGMNEGTALSSNKLRNKDSLDTGYSYAARVILM